MRHLDFSPLYRSTVGFDRLFSLLDAANGDVSNSYPPYNIELTGENTYRISMAIAGFSEGELTIEAKESVLLVKGEKQQEEDDKNYLYRGIATRTFERRFQLADYVEVRGASLENGLLHIDLVREIPDAMKPRKIDISVGESNTKQIEGSKAK